MKNNPIDDVVLHIDAAISEWATENQPQKLKDKIKSKLDRKMESTILQLMGFDKRYSGVWEVDHCNGRAGNSVVGDALKTELRDEIVDWVKSAGIPEMNDKLKKALQKEYKDIYYNMVRQEISVLIKNHVKQEAEECFEIIKNSKVAVDYINTLKIMGQGT